MRSLSIERPDLIKEWHTTRNGNLNPDKLGLYSNKKVWWKCGRGHEYQSVVANRVRTNQNCPYCSGQRVCIENSLATKYPELIKEWDIGKNNGLMPSDFTACSNHDVWWLCDKGHSWHSRIDKRTLYNHGCPYCCNNKVCIDNCLATVAPHLLAEWDYEKNTEYTPYDILPKTKHKPFWKCKRGHKFSMRVDHRVNGHGCPKCNGQDSKLQLFLFSEIKYYFPNAIYKYKINNAEIDIYLPDYKIGIELSGYWWHKDKLEVDRNKSDIFDTEGIIIINIRENGLDEINGNTVRYNKQDNPLNISKNMMKCLCGIIKDSRLVDYQDINAPINEKEYLNNVAKYPAPPYEKSLEFLNPELAKEWCYDLNGNLKPSDVHARSRLKVWWQCKEKHAPWSSTINNRHGNEQGCPICWSYRRKKNAIL
jgi:hypothetical protein